MFKKEYRIRARLKKYWGLKRKQEGAGFVAPTREVRDGRRSEACFLSSSRYEVVVDGKKMVGSAQRRTAGGFLQHGSILAEVDSEALEAVFGPDLVRKITWLGAHTTATVEQLRRALVKSVATFMEVELTEAGLSEVELGSVAKELDRGQGAEGLIKSVRRVV
jgi:lipoate-protein ligase A